MSGCGGEVQTHTRTRVYTHVNSLQTHDKCIYMQVLANKQVTYLCFQAILPMEFMYKGDRISLSFVEAIIHTPAVSKGGISSDLRVFPAECRGRRCTYRGKLVVSLTIT